MPNKILANKNIAGIKNHKDRLNIGCVSNADGSDKPKLVCISRMKKTRCFGNNFNPNVYVDYFNNSKAWMTCEIF